MNTSILEVLDGPDGKAMYFVKGMEIAPPKLLPYPVKTKHGDVVAFSQGGLRTSCLFKKFDVEGFILEKVEIVPSWILNLQRNRNSDALLT